MTPPSYLRGRKPIKMSLHSVMDILKSIDDLGHSDNFRQAAKDKAAFVTVHPAAVNFVKDYLANNNLHQQSDVAKSVVGACPPDDPYHCPYSQVD